MRIISSQPTRLLVTPIAFELPAGDREGTYVFLETELAIIKFGKKSIYNHVLATPRKEAEVFFFEEEVIEMLAVNGVVQVVTNAMPRDEVVHARISYDALPQTNTE